MQGATTLLVAGCNSLVAQAKYYSSFQLMHMSCHDEAQSRSQQWRPKGDKRLLQCSQLRLHGAFLHTSVSDYGCVVRTFVGPSVRAVLATKVEESTRAMAADGNTNALATPHQGEFQYQTCTVALGQCMIVITTVQYEPLYAIPITQLVTRQNLSSYQECNIGC